MSQDPEEKLVIERRSAEMKAAYELLAEFGAQLHGFDPGVTAFIGERPQMIVSGQGRGAWGENLSFTREEWKWLRPLLEELRDLRGKAQAMQDAQSQIDASKTEARDLPGHLNLAGRPAGTDMNVTIVLARIETTQTIVKHGRIDLGEPHTLEDVPVPVAVRWLQSGGTADIQAAQKYAADNGYQVFTYLTSEPDPLGRARNDVMKKASSVGGDKCNPS